MKIYNRIDKEYFYENESGETSLKFLYNNCIGRIILKIIINPIFSCLYGIYKKSFISKIEVNSFINKNNIDKDKFILDNYKSFNDVFTRKYKDEYINIDKVDTSFISPCESKLLVYKISDDLKVNIKGSLYSLFDIIDGELDESYIGGNCLVFRLSLNNYHRFCYPDSGRVLNSKSIKGVLHTVRSISSNYEIYKKNKRVVSYLDTDNFDHIIMIEVGALFVGDIVNHKIDTFNKGDEKGYFNIGGSTIVVLTKKNVVIDKDIIENSKNDIEVFVNYGEKIGKISK